MFDRSMQVFAFLIVSCCIFPAVAQNTQDEFWPKFDLYLQQSEDTRLESDIFLNQDQSTRYRQGAYSYYIDLALKPVFRRELRWKDDVFRQRYLTFRAGYEYTTSLLNADASSENRGIVEVTSRYALPGSIVLADRNRGDFRFVHGQPFSERYRNRLRADRDFSIGRFRLTPYAYDEVFYDARYHAWTTNRYAIGVQVPAGPHLVVETYVLRQNNERASPPHLEAVGLTFNLFF
jgi:Protein of unknown function (DUF2490)